MLWKGLKALWEQPGSWASDTGYTQFWRSRGPLLSQQLLIREFLSRTALVQSLGKPLSTKIKVKFVSETKIGSEVGRECNEKTNGERDYRGES